MQEDEAVRCILPRIVPVDWKKAEGERKPTDEEGEKLLHILKPVKLEPGVRMNGESEYGMRDILSRQGGDLDYDILDHGSQNYGSPSSSWECSTGRLNRPEVSHLNNLRSPLHLAPPQENNTPDSHAQASTQHPSHIMHSPKRKLYTPSRGFPSEEKRARFSSSPNIQETGFASPLNRHSQPIKHPSVVAKEKVEEKLILPTVLLLKKIEDVVILQPTKLRIVEALNDGSISYKAHLKQQLVRSIAHNITTLSLQRMDIPLCAAFVRMLLRPFPLIDPRLFVSDSNSPVMRRVGNLRRELGKSGIIRLGKYTKKAKKEDLNAEREMSLSEQKKKVLAIGDHPQGTLMYLRLLRSTRDFRLKFASNNSPTATFNLVPAMAADPNQLIEDFLISLGLERRACFYEEFDDKWTDRILREGEDRIKPERWSQLFSEYGREVRQVKALLIALEIGTLITAKKKAKTPEARLHSIFQHHPTVTDPYAVISELKKYNHPIIFKISSNTAFYLSIEGVPISLSTSFGHALLALLTYYHIFKLKYPPEVAELLSLIERLIGMAQPTRSTIASNIYTLLNPSQEEE